MSEAAKPEMMQHPHGNFCWIELGTTDADAAKRFYSSVLGWNYEDTSMGPDQVYTMINLDGKTIGALYKIGPEQQGMPPNWQPYINVNKADETVAKARELGASIVVEPFDVAKHGRMAVLTDPTGATIAIWQPKEHHGAQLVNATGAMCWMSYKPVIQNLLCSSIRASWDGKPRKARSTPNGSIKVKKSVE